MSNVIKLFISKVLPLQSGVSQRTGKPWKIQSYVGQTIEQNPKNVCFSFMNEQADSNVLNQGEIYEVSFDLESREWTDRNGNTRWSTEVRAWKTQHVANPAETAAPSQPASPMDQQATAFFNAQPNPVQNFSAPVSPAPQQMAQPRPTEELPF